MIRSHTVREHIDAPVATVFDWFSNADALSRWSGTLAHVVSGPRHGAVGTIRRVLVGPVEVDEEIVVCERPRRLAYRIVRGVPLRHHYAEVVLEEDSDGTCVVEWSHRFESRVPGVARLLNRLATRSLERGLPRLRSLVK